MNNSKKFDAIIIDFPDPSNYSIGKLYTNSFYKLVKRSLAPAGIAVIQSTSPLVAPKSFWCIDHTLQSVGFQTKPYHNLVPSFGEWGYIIVTQDSTQNWFGNIPAGLKFVNKTGIDYMLFFPPDMKTTDSLEINKLNNQALVNYFETEWAKYLDI